MTTGDVGGERGTLGANVRRLRIERGWTQAELARRAKIDRAHVFRIEDGTYKSPRRENVEKLARALNCDVIELTGYGPKRVATPYETNARYRALIDALESLDESDRDYLVSQIEWFSRRLAMTHTGFENVIQFATPKAATKKERRQTVGASTDGDDDFPPPPIPIDEWIEKDADRPRPLHAWVKPVAAEAAAGPPRNPDDILIPSAQVLNSLREVRDDRVHVIKIIDDSMFPVLRNGWKVLLDPSRKLFQPGRIVMVYLKDEGSTIGMLASEGERLYIKKRNPEYADIQLPAGEWYPVGTITTIVEAPVEIE